MLIYDRLAEAFTFAVGLHRTQLRNGTRTPYLLHLMAVASIAFEHGADEDEAIAALLHDAAEDQGGAPTLAEIGRRFGARVADCCDAHCDYLADWHSPISPR